MYDGDHYMNIGEIVIGNRYIISVQMNVVVSDEADSKK
jgi:hypothetical protein